MVTLLKMLGLYLYTFIIGQTSYNMLSILNKLTLQINSKIVWQISFFDCITQQQQNKTSNIKTLAGPVN